MAALAIFLTPASVLIRLLESIALIIWLTHRLRSLSVQRVLQHQDADDRWRVICRRRSGSRPHCKPFFTLRSKPSCGTFGGRLVKLGYRSPWIVILAIQTDDTRIYRVPIWQDQVSGVDFSYLHQQMAFAATPPVRRTMSAWLAGLLTSAHHTS